MSRSKPEPAAPRVAITHSRGLTLTSEEGDIRMGDLDDLMRHARRLGYANDARVTFHDASAYSLLLHRKFIRIADNTENLQ